MTPISGFKKTVNLEKKKEKKENPSGATMIAKRQLTPEISVALAGNALPVLSLPRGTAAPPVDIGR